MVVVILSIVKNLMDKVFYVYIATNWNNKVMYTGVTSNLVARMFQHKNKQLAGFTSRYNVDKLVFYEMFTEPLDAIAAEKRIKGWKRQKKIDLIVKANPNFEDLLKEYQDPSLCSG